MVKLEYVAPNGDNRIIRLLGEGSVIGLELLDTAESYYYNAVAIDQVDLCKIPVSTVKHLEVKYPHMSHNIREQLQRQLNLADEWIFSLSTGTAKQRVAHLVRILHENYADNNGAFILLHRDDMAAIISIATETISRMVAKFKRKNILYKSDGHLYKCDISAIEKIAYSK